MSERFHRRLADLARSRPQHLALEDAERRVDYASLIAEIEARIARLRAAGASRVGLALDNGVDWALWDLALLFAGIVNVPLPGFFSATQLTHVADQAGLDTLIGPSALGEALGFSPGADAALWERGVDAPPPLPTGTVKITFTSGTSGAPKGVCLDAEAPLRVAESLAEVAGECGVQRHLAMLPLATLLENIGGLYAPLWLGATSVLPGLATLGWQGASGFDVTLAHRQLETHRPHSLILVPQLLEALLATSRQSTNREARFIAVGGARVAPSLLEAAHAAGWPVFEGYGLSECASVVTLNRPGDNRPGSLGRPLPHARLTLADDGEIHVAGNLMLGYLGDASPMPTAWPTGDLARWEDGHLILEGRRRQLFITAYGRNVDPAWVEAELTAEPAIAQAWVYGEALPANRALLVPARADLDETRLAAAVAVANARLPDYARITHWRRTVPFSAAEGLITANGRLRREVLAARHRDWLEAPLDAAAVPHSGPSLPGGDPMSPYQRLQQATADSRAWLLAAPILQRALEGRISRDEYLAFLGQAYHHVKYTVPLMMACGARLPERLEWLRGALVEYIAEEYGHQRWILDDIRNAGGDPDHAAASRPAPATELMVRHVRDVIAHDNPVGFFGMVFVLEGTSTALATRAAGAIRDGLGLPEGAFHYLESHGDLDVGHLAFFEGLIDRLDDAADLQAVIDTANMVYRLYGAMFRGLDAGGDPTEALGHALV
ncbi:MULTISPECIES: AMP-binding protein [unclassified Modicisalibacter]|uniref:AMP-binding protein n=1 Tax=unclassified Modicisalibacter TaxID=2679913 RepID=UPI0031BA092E